MTIKEFAKLCNCNPQTLRYMFDKYGDEHLNVACNINESKDGQNHFWLLKAK